MDTLELALRDEYRRWFAPASDANGPPALRLVHKLRQLIAGLGDRVHRVFHGFPLDGYLDGHFRLMRRVRQTAVGNGRYAYATDSESRLKSSR